MPPAPASFLDYLHGLTTVPAIVHTADTLYAEGDRRQFWRTIARHTRVVDPALLPLLARAATEEGGREGEGGTLPDLVLSNPHLSPGPLADMLAGWAEGPDTAMGRPEWRRWVDLVVRGGLVSFSHRLMRRIEGEFRLGKARTVRGGGFYGDDNWHLLLVLSCPDTPESLLCELAPLLRAESHFPLLIMHPASTRAVWHALAENPTEGMLSPLASMPMARQDPVLRAAVLRDMASSNQGGSMLWEPELFVHGLSGERLAFALERIGRQGGRQASVALERALTVSRVDAEALSWLCQSEDAGVRAWAATAVTSMLPPVRPTRPQR